MQENRFGIKKIENIFGDYNNNKIDSNCIFTYKLYKGHIINYNIIIRYRYINYNYYGINMNRYGK